MVPREVRTGLSARLVGAGLSQQQTAETLGVSQRQVGNDVSNSSNVSPPTHRVDSLGRRQATALHRRPWNVRRTLAA